jgi:hypothetical protein
MNLEKNFNANKFCVNNTGCYLLDTNDRQLLFIDNDYNTKYSGGYGLAGDAFINPIDILTSNLNVYVVDGTENKIISFDHKLNYISTIVYIEIYPTICTIDDWGNILLYSQLDNKIYKVDYPSYSISEFIDLTLYAKSDLEPIEIYVASDGSIGLLYDGSVLLFNRLGQFKRLILTAESYNAILKIKDIWFAIDKSNSMINILDDQEYKYLPTKNIIDLFHLNNRLYLLYKDKISIIDVETD